MFKIKNDEFVNVYQDIGVTHYVTFSIGERCIKSVKNNCTTKLSCMVFAGILNGINLSNVKFTDTLNTMIISTDSCRIEIPKHEAHPMEEIKKLNLSKITLPDLSLFSIVSKFGKSGLDIYNEGAVSMINGGYLLQDKPFDYSVSIPTQVCSKIFHSKNIWYKYDGVVLLHEDEDGVKLYNTIKPSESKRVLMQYKRRTLIDSYRLDTSELCRILKSLGTILKKDSTIEFIPSSGTVVIENNFIKSIIVSTGFKNKNINPFFLDINIVRNLLVEGLLDFNIYKNSIGIWNGKYEIVLAV